VSTLAKETNGQVATPPRSYPEASYEDVAPEKGAGWLLFSAIFLGFAGVFGFIDGPTQPYGDEDTIPVQRLGD